MGSVERAEDAGSEVESCDEEMIITNDRAKQMKNLITGVDLIAALNRGEDFLADIPAPVKKRVKALKNLHLKLVNLEADFYEQVHQLEVKYHTQYQTLYDKRAEIVNAKYEPTEEECTLSWANANDDEDEELVSKIKGATIKEIKDNETNEEAKNEEDIKGIPDFWLTIFRNVSMLADMMQENDEPIVAKLLDIKVKLKENPMGFLLEFYFAPNEYFTNTVLTKEYLMKCKPDEENPLDFEGPEIYLCKGCEINWNKGKNVTVKTIKKKQKHKSRGSVRTVSKSVQADSFFNFFNPPEMPNDPESQTIPDVQALLTTDFEIGHYIRERVVPRAVLLYTGEGLTDDEEDYDDEEEEEECTSEDESEEESPQKFGSRSKRKAVKAGDAHNNKQQTPADCKQQ